jgi:hypothetical protein
MPKRLDHRSNKTYDIKPVDKRGNLDVDRIAKRESLVRFKNSKREEREAKAAKMLNRFKEHRKKVLQERLIFDIGARKINQVLKEEISEEFPLEEEIAVAQSIGSDMPKEVEKDETPEEVLENFRKKFSQEQNSLQANPENKKEKQREVFSPEQKQEFKTVLEEYCVIHGNQKFAPLEIAELRLVKIGDDVLQKLKPVSCEKKPAKEIINKGDSFVTEKKIETKLDIESSGEGLENFKNSELHPIDTLERKNFFGAEIKDIGEKVPIKKLKHNRSGFDEATIDNKLNAWFDCGIVEPTMGREDTEQRALLSKKGALKIAGKKSLQRSQEKKFTDQVPTAKKTKQKSRFFSSNYRKNGEAFRWQTLVAKPMLSFVAVSFIAFLAIGSVVFVSYGFQIQENVKVKGEQALGHLDDAKNQLEGQDFLSAKTSFSSAVNEFEAAQKELDMIGGDMLNIFSTFPLLSKISSGKNVVDAGNELTKAAKELAGVVEILSEIEVPFGGEDGKINESGDSMLDALLGMQAKLKIANESLIKAEKNLELIKIADLPEEYQDKFQKIKDTLPMILSIIDIFEQNSEIFLELLGHNGPRKYLMLFQNNQEMRATGGFIGSYGVLHISNGKITKFLIDGIYNPDGQLKYNIVPPLPIQKISASWSTHDANWFPHFPKTAEKIAMFYEYTGGPTVDGIITMTPMVLQRMLAVTGPIEMEEYQKTVNAENFVEITQHEVEVDYDKEENKPKQFLADLAPKIITELFDARDSGDASEILEIFSDMLKERNIMVHSSNEDVQAIISKRGWSGEILSTEKDYLMVINSNINGFKTDGVVDESIVHNAKIAEDGTITNTVKIKRVHNGGDTGYEWWDKVNSNYMRVYVPKGSKLISVKGQTREINEPLLDYDKLNFKRDEDVVAEEASINIDEETGTRIYEEEGKTVFANWVYVSPKETVEIEYTYELPFKLDTAKNEEAADTYSLLVQKQAGSFGSEFASKIEHEQEIKPIWMYPQEIEKSENNLEIKAKLTADLFFGTVFQKEGAQTGSEK